MNKDKAIQLLERLQDPEPYEPMLTKDAYDAIQMAIDALSADGDTISRASLMSELKDMHHEAEKWVADAKNDDVKARAESCLVTITEIKLRVDKMPPAQPERIKGRWISVTENTLPDKNRVVVVCGEKGTWDYGMYRGYCNSNIHLWEWKKKTLKWVYWWMYKEDALPEPYKEVTT